MQINNPQGTAARYNTGTSGAVVPILNGAATTWGAGATFNGTVTGNNVAAVTGIYIGGGLAFSKSGDYNVLTDEDSVIKILIGPAGDPTTYLNNTTYAFRSLDTLTTFATINATGLDVLGLARCDNLRIDRAPVAGAVVQSHTITVNLNGTDYKLLCLPA